MSTSSLCDCRRKRLDLNHPLNTSHGSRTVRGHIQRCMHQVSLGSLRAPLLLQKCSRGPLPATSRSGRPTPPTPEVNLCNAATQQTSQSDHLLHHAAPVSFSLSHGSPSGHFAHLPNALGRACWPELNAGAARNTSAGCAPTQRDPAECRAAGLCSIACTGLSHLPTGLAAEHVCCATANMLWHCLDARGAEVRSQRAVHAVSREAMLGACEHDCAGAKRVLRARMQGCIERVVWRLGAPFALSACFQSCNFSAAHPAFPCFFERWCDTQIAATGSACRSLQSLRPAQRDKARDRSEGSGDADASMSEML